MGNARGSDHEPKRRRALGAGAVAVGIAVGAGFGTVSASGATPAPNRGLSNLPGVSVTTSLLPAVSVPTVSTPAVTVAIPGVPKVTVPSTTVTAPVTVTTPTVPSGTVTTPTVPKVPSTPDPPSITPPSTPAPPAVTRSPTPTIPTRTVAPARGHAASHGPRPGNAPPAHRTAGKARTIGPAHRHATANARRRDPGKPRTEATAAKQARRARRTNPATGGSLPDLIGGEIPLPLPVPDWSKPIILALLLLSIGFGLRARLTARRARGLERTQQALTADLLAMQSALVPELPPRLGELEISAAYSPADGPAAGGDFYDAFSLDRNRVAIILGDVSGHGRAALAHAARMRYTVRAYVEAGLAPREALSLAGSVIGTSDGLFTTVAVAIHDVTTASLTYATAGHPPPLATGNAKHEPVTVASPPLGWGVPCGRRQTTVPFPAGTTACFFSDGLIEARTDSDFLGREGLAEIFEQLDSAPSARALLDHVQSHALQIRDDMAACIIRSARGPLGPGVQIRLEELELDLEQLAQGHGHRFLDSCGVAAADIPDAIAAATGIATDHGLALLAVTLPDRSWRVSTSVVVAITPSTPSSSGPDHPSAPSEPRAAAGRPPSQRRPGRFVVT